MTEAPGYSLPVTLPANLDAEQRLVGSVLVEPGLMAHLPQVEPSDFTEPYCAQIWETMLGLFRSGVPIDAAVILEALRPTWAAAPALRDRMVEYLHSLVTCPISVNAAPELARIIRELSDRRTLIQIASSYIRDAQDMGSLERADLRERFIGDLAGMNSRLDGFRVGHRIVQGIVQDLGKPRFVDSTGLSRLDELTVGGFHRHRYYGIGGRRKSGKSNFLASIAYNMAMQGTSVAYLTLESTPEEIVHRIMARHIRANALEFQKPDMSPWVARKIVEHQDFLKGKGLVFGGRPQMPLEELAGAIAKLGIRGKVRGVFVDYVQLVGGRESRGTSAEHHDRVSQTLADLAKTYDLWICCAFQLNREGDARGGDGLMMACDMALGIHHLEIDGREDEVWLECMASRYAPESHIGDENNGAFRLNRQHGPYFEEIPQ